MCVQKVAGASPDRWDHGAPTGQRGPPGRGDNVFVHTPITRPAACAQVDVTFLNDYDVPELHIKCRSLKMRTRRASLVSSVKTRSVQDTFHDACFCLTRHNLFKAHFTMLVSVSPTPCQLLWFQ